MRYYVVEKPFDHDPMDPIRLSAESAPFALGEAEMRFGNDNNETVMLYRMTSSGRIDLIQKWERNPPCAACGKESSYRDNEGDWLCDDPAHHAPVPAHADGEDRW